MKIKVESVSAERFAPFGDVLEFPEDAAENFRIVVREESSSWRLAVFRFTRHVINRIENHPSSRESFVPLKGSAILVAAEHEKPSELTAFFLDKPICLYRGIWHEVLALTPEAQVTITENLDVNSEYFELKEPLSVFLG
jgi:ureidoglycolate hydrolase